MWCIRNTSTKLSVGIYLFFIYRTNTEAETLYLYTYSWNIFFENHTPHAPLTLCITPSSLLVFFYCGANVSNGKGSCAQQVKRILDVFRNSWDHGSVCGLTNTGLHVHCYCGWSLVFIGIKYISLDGKANAPTSV